MGTTVKPSVDSVVIDGATFIREDSIKVPVPIGDIKIVILQRGWVYVGRFSQDGEMCKLENAQNIRRFGTTKGLGQIALNGPTSTTELDPSGTVEFNIVTTIAMINCNAEKWSLI